MYWSFAAGFSGVCACERRSSGAEKKSRNANNLRGIFIREKILAFNRRLRRRSIPSRRLWIKLRLHNGRGRGGATTSFLLPALLAGPRRRRRSRPLRGAAGERLASSGRLPEFRSRARG